MISLSWRRTAWMLALGLLGATAFAPSAQAQETPADTVRRPLSPTDSATVVRREEPDSADRRISPRGAFLRSLVLPGWGQSEIGAPERGIIYFALEAGSLWMVYKSDRKLSEARRRELYLRETGQLPVGTETGLVRDRRAQREDWITLSVFWLFFSGADAFVGAYLRDFDASVGVSPDEDGAVRLQATVPVGGKRR